MCVLEGEGSGGDGAEACGFLGGVTFGAGVGGAVGVKGGVGCKNVATECAFYVVVYVGAQDACSDGGGVLVGRGGEWGLCSF